MKISIIIPTLNEADNIEHTLVVLQNMRQQQHEIIISDGGSSDNTVELATPLVDKIIHSAKGRALQMNTGALHATGDVLWFLHSDTIAPSYADCLIEQYLLKHNKYWGRFNVKLSGQQKLFRVIEKMINLRSCLTGIATGDQGIFINANVFKAIDGFKTMPLMEDVDISQRLIRHSGRPGCVKNTLLTSSRRWEQHGIIKTILLMWRLRLAYYLGAQPEQLAKYYPNN